MYVGNNELTITDDDITTLMMWLEYDELSFQSRVNRDAVARACKEYGMRVKKSSSGHQIIDPRYTAEGKLAGLPDKGLANDSIVTTLYNLRKDA